MFIFSPDEIERLKKEMGKKNEIKEIKEETEDTKTKSNDESKESDSGNESSGSSSGPSTPDKDDFGTKFTESSDSLLNGDINTSSYNSVKGVDITSASVNQPILVDGQPLE